MKVQKKQTKVKHTPVTMMGQCIWRHVHVVMERVNSCVVRHVLWFIILSVLTHRLDVYPEGVGHVKCVLGLIKIYPVGGG